MERYSEYSRVETRHIIMPGEANPIGNVFGGVIMCWMDLAAAMVAQKHSSSEVATVHIDEVHFNAPMAIGEHVLVNAKLAYAGKTSMVIMVDVFSENPRSNSRKKTTNATFTFVAVDEKGKPRPVPALKLSGSDEEQAFIKIQEKIKLKK